MRLQQAAALLLLLGSLCKGQQMTHEEEVVRTTYARLAFAGQINEIHNQLKEKRKSGKHIDRTNFQLRMQANTLQFELTDFKVGPLSDISQTKYSDLVTKPSRTGGDSLYIAAGNFNYSKDGMPSTSAIAMAEWGPSRDLNEDWDIPFAAGYAQGEWAGQHQRYASFNVKVTFQGRSREYRAMFLFGAKGLVSALDTVIDINGNALSRFIDSDAYPETLIEGGLGNEDPVVREWIDAKQVLRGRQGTANCDPVAMTCGIHNGDIRKLEPAPKRIGYERIMRSAPRLIEASFHPRLNLNAAAIMQDNNCSTFNNVTALSPGVVFDNTNHLSGGHTMTTARTTDCTYSNGNNTNGNCNTQCDVTMVPQWAEVGNTFGSSCHQTGLNVQAGFATATGSGASCTGVSGGGVKVCTLCQCNVSVSILGISVSSDGFFTATTQGSNSCVAQVQTPPPPPPPPPPCSPPPPDQQFTVDPDANPDCEPLIVDVTGEGFQLTNTAGGVVFDIRADRRPLRIPWTTGSTNAFLVLDRNGNGMVDDGSELFGNVTPQPIGNVWPNGFLALAQYDKPENGGNGDGVIDSRDAVFSSLRLWVDANHDGISQPTELHMLPELGVFSISLDYSLSRRTDEFGNVFRLKARVNQGQNAGSDVGPKIYDVFFVNK
ncbi:MAG TPA: hypothetical protein VNZ47_13760 [Candidatus Dormibacteraeota bacterium]|nr:hypothetical protein [Candidatus Dormibacteraeota bacterium]